MNKKLIASVLSLAMVAASCIPAFAEDGKVTYKEASDGGLVISGESGVAEPKIEVTIPTVADGNMFLINPYAIDVSAKAEEIAGEGDVSVSGDTIVSKVQTITNNSDVKVGIAIGEFKAGAKDYGKRPACVSDNNAVVSDFPVTIVGKATGCKDNAKKSMYLALELVSGDAKTTVVAQQAYKKPKVADGVVDTSSYKDNKGGETKNYAKGAPAITIDKTGTATMQLVGNVNTKPVVSYKTVENGKKVSKKADDFWTTADSVNVSYKIKFIPIKNTAE